MNKLNSYHTNINLIGLCLVFSVIAFLSYAQPVSTFIKNYESVPQINSSPSSYINLDDPTKNKLISSMSDGSLIVAYNGKMGSENTFVILRISPTGNVIWEKSQALSNNIGSPYFRIRPTCITIKNDIIYIAGEASSGIQISTYVIKMDANGNVLFNSIHAPNTIAGISGIVEVWPRDILVNNDHVFIIGHAESSSVTTNNNLYALKLNQNLDYLNQRYYRHPIYSSLGFQRPEKMSVCERGNELCIFFHAGNYAGPYEASIGVLKIQKNDLIKIPTSDIVIGNITSFTVPQKVFYDASSDRFSVITKNADGMPGFLQLRGDNFMPYNPWKSFAVSSTVNTNNINGNNTSYISAFHIPSGPNQGYYLCGDIVYIDNNNFPIEEHEIKYYAKLDLNGDILWMNGVSELNAQIMWSDYNNIVVTNEGIYSIQNSINSSTMLSLVKTNFDGEMIGNCKNYPLTFTESITDVFQFNVPQISDFEMNESEIPFNDDDPIEIEKIDYCGCDPFTIIISPSQSGMICANEFPITLSASVGPILGTSSTTYTYSWSSPNGSFTGLIDPNGSVPEIIVDTEGTYTVTATSADGCTSTASYTVEIALPPVWNIVELGNPCDGIMLYSDNSFSNYCWYEQSDPSTCLGTNNNFIPSTSGTYCLEVEDSYGCTSVQCVTVQVSPPLDVYAINPVVELCVGESLNMVNFNISSSVFEFPLFSPSTGGSLDFSGLIGLPCGIDVNLIYGWPPIISSIDFVASPCNIGTNTLSYTFTNQFGCSDSASMEIIVNDIPNGEIDPIDDINLCMESQAFPITYVCNAGPGGFSELEVLDASGIQLGLPEFDPTTEVFNPALAGPGTYTVNLKCINDCGIHTDSQTFTVDEVLSWHQTTKNSENREIINDVITDAEGNIYVTGNKFGNTTLNGGFNIDITLNSINPNMGAFIAKYDPCGSLLWGASIYGTDQLSSNSIVVDEINQTVFITGNVQRISTAGSYVFESSITAGSTAPSITNMNIPSWVAANFPSALAGEFEHGYVAAYSMDDGIVNSVDMILGEFASNVTSSPPYNPDVYSTDCRAITINESNGDVFVGGMRTVILGAQEQFGYFVSKYNPYNMTSIPFGFNEWVWHQQDDQPRYNRINDMDFRETDNTLHLIGEMNRKLAYKFGGSGSSFTNYLYSGKRDAFIGSFTDNGNSSFSIHKWRNAGTIGTYRISGKGVAVDESSGWVYYTGSYKQTDDTSDPLDFNSDPFNFVSDNWASNGTFLPGDGDFFRSYHIGADYINERAWCDFGVSDPSPNQPHWNVKGTDVNYNNGRTYFCGDTDGNNTEFNSGDALTGGIPASTSITSINAGLENVFVFQTNSDDGNFGWINLIEGGINSSNSMHRSRAITTDNNGHSFVVGEYRGELDVVFGNPASGVLTSSAATGAINGFIVRGQNTTGELRNNADNSEDILEDDSYIAKIYPNPVNETLFIEFQEQEKRQYFELKITNNLGQVVIQKKVLGIGIHRIDMGNMNTGLYHVHVRSEQVNQTFKLIKQ